MHSGYAPIFSICKYTHFKAIMNTLDVILLICFLPAIIQGFRKGFISQVIAIVAIIAGAHLSLRFSPEVTQWMEQYIHASQQILKVASFALIFIAAAIVLNMAGRLIEGVVKLVMLGWLNKLLGVAFSLIKAGLIAGLAIMVFCSLNNTFGIVSEEVLNESVLFTPIKNLAYTVFPHLKELLFWNN